MSGDGQDADATVAALVKLEPALWGAAILFFGVGDLVTTSIGLQDGQLVEVGPVAAPVIARYGLAAIIPLKVATFTGCIGFWLWTPRPYNVGVSLGLAVTGILVTGWNLLLLGLT